MHLLLLDDDRGTRPKFGGALPPSPVLGPTIGVCSRYTHQKRGRSRSASPRMNLFHESALLCPSPQQREAPPLATPSARSSSLPGWDLKHWARAIGVCVPLPPCGIIHPRRRARFRGHPHLCVVVGQPPGLADGVWGGRRRGLVGVAEHERVQSLLRPTITCRHTTHHKGGGGAGLGDACRPPILFTHSPHHHPQGTTRRRPPLARRRMPHSSSSSHQPP